MTTDAIVTPDGMLDAENIVEQMDSDAAVAWLRQSEDTLAMWTHRQSLAVIDLLQNQHQTKLSDAARSAVVRAVTRTAITTIVALQAAHHELWLDLVAGSKLSTIDPLLAIRRRALKVNHEQDPLPLKDKVDNVPATVTKFAFVSFRPALRASERKRADTFLLTSVGAKRTLRHEMVNLTMAKRMLECLVDALADQGFDVAEAARKALNGQQSETTPDSPKRPKGQTKPLEDAGDDNS